MADLDDLREGSNFGLGVSSQQQSFHVKGAENLPWGMKDRLSRIFNPKTGKAVMLAFDHGFIRLYHVYTRYPSVFNPDNNKQTYLFAFGCWYFYPD